MSDDDEGLGDISNIIELANFTAKQVPLLTEDSAALAFAERYRGQFLFDHDAKSWFRWTGQHWTQERTRLAFEWARQLVRDLGENEVIKVKGLSRKTCFTNGVEKFAQADRIFAVAEQDWNKDPYLLATAGGTVDLRTGQVRAADPADRINKITAATPLEVAECPRWYAFLAEATGKDDELIAFLQRWCGYCLTGDIREHALVFCYGPGGNGKTVMLNTISAILGGYAVTAAMETFTASQFERHPTDLAMLCGARLVSASETEEGRAWAENKIKQITGGDPITARYMRCDFFTYHPTFKLMIIGNHEPTLRNVDDAARRRFNVVPFLRKPQLVDKQLPNKLHDEWPGILRWMIDGCLAWQAEGLAPPETVRAATTSYFDNQDIFSQWLEEKCNAVPGDREKTAPSADLFASWSAFAKAAGETPGSRKSFARLLERKGFQPYRRGDKKRTRAWYGIYVWPESHGYGYGAEDD
jgi:putative DNA primase/helicase